jgi:hypothetical protein
VNVAQKTAQLALDAGHRQASHHGSPARHADGRQTLSAFECGTAVGVFIAWIALFAVGILVDTEPYRRVISPTAVTKLATEATGAQRQEAAKAAAPAPPVSSRSGLMKSWAIVIFCFLPVNLVWLCATSSTLGAFGNRANLTNDRAGRQARDNNNPYIAAVLRGFFAYLFLISGLLLLDDAPFSNPAPAQYVRLAGFLSLLSFVISYQPRFFNTLIVWAFHRIQAREGQENEDSGKTSTDTHAFRKTVEIKETHSTQSTPTIAPHDSVATHGVAGLTAGGTAGPRPDDQR